MKGTIDATIRNAAEVLENDGKEAAEHATIVDLIRNDLSIVADKVHVERYRYLDLIETNRGRIFQTSSEVAGRLHGCWQSRLGDIVFSQLPAGSITGAPKPETMRIIADAENYERGNGMLCRRKARQRGNDKVCRNPRGKTVFQGGRRNNVKE